MGHGPSAVWPTSGRPGRASQQQRGHLLSSPLPSHAHLAVLPLTALAATSPPAQRSRPARTGPVTGQTPSSCINECPFLGRLPSVRSRAVLFGAVLDSQYERCGTASQGDVLGSPHWSQIQILDPPPTCGVTWYKLTAPVRFRFLT